MCKTVKCVYMCRILSKYSCRLVRCARRIFPSVCSQMRGVSVRPTRHPTHSGTVCTIVPVGYMLFPMLSAEWLHLVPILYKISKLQNITLLFRKHLVDIRSEACWLNLFWEYINRILFTVYVTG